jgi:serine protease DegQ
MLRRLWLVFSQAVTLALALLFVVATLKPQWLPGAAPAAALPPATISVVPAVAGPQPVASGSAVALAPGSLAVAARLASPAVVSIVSTKMSRRHPATEDPHFRFFFGERGNPAQTGLGSGVLVSPEGYLLTNNHVIEGADEIEVQLADGRQAQARLVGSDPDTDLAVLRVDLQRLPVVSFGDMRSLQVGDAVLAIGNPFNVGQTVTAGIVSALGRNRLGLSTFENFIQTDAAINPGNSGGALVDAQGHLVGINTAIFSRSGGSMGIGFAIPVDLARQVMNGLITDGQVRRGWIGVVQRDLTGELAQNLGLPVKAGALITGVLQDGPAARAGIKPGDVVVKVAEQAVGDTSTLLDAVTALPPGKVAVLEVRRAEQLLRLDVVVGLRPKSNAPR